MGRMRGWRMLLLMALSLSVSWNAVVADEAMAEQGWKLLRTKAYLPPDFDQQVFDELWKVWPEPERSKARTADVAARRKLIFSRYGLMEAPDRDGTGPALGYVDNGQGDWIMNCLACHAGKVAGKVIPGLPNSHTALHSLTEDVRLTKLRLFKKPGHLDLASLKMPLGTTHGTTNSVIFGVALGNIRDRDMGIDRTRQELQLVHHDMDAPPFWNVKKKRSLYADGFAPKNHRVLMQFMLLPSNGPDKLSAWEADFKAVMAWIESLSPPQYPFEIDRGLASRGQKVFEKYCLECHGSYGQNGKYEQRTVSIDVVKTDRVRLDALSREHREWMKDGWMSRYGEDAVDVSPQGYVAPPLDGVWASAPYFHNGSVPTLWHVLHPEQRPRVWTRTEDGYDQERVGLEVSVFESVPSAAQSSYEKRRYFNTSAAGKSAAGHDFPNQLSEAEKSAVLEYLKSL